MKYLSRRDSMKQIIFIMVLAVLFLAGCSLTTQDGVVVVNFCDLISDYADCSAIELTEAEIEMTLNVESGVIVDSVVFELPNPDDNGNTVYCSTSGALTPDDDTYIIEVPCDLSEYAGQNTQLNFVVTVSVTDSSGTSTVTLEGQAEDYVEE